MKKLYMHTIIGSSGKDFVLTILFQLYGSKAGIFKCNLFWVGHYDPFPNLHIGRRTNPIYILYMHTIIDINTLGTCPMFDSLPPRS